MVVRGTFVGIATVDLVHRVEQPPMANQKITALGQEVAAGGPAANAAVTFARLGGEATLITALGRHPLARYAADELTSQGVRVLDAAPDASAPPAVSSIVVTDATGDRQVVSVNAAGHWAAHPAAAPAELPEADVTLVDGHHPALARAAVAPVPAPGATSSRAGLVILDGGSWKPVLADLLPWVGYAVCSADFHHPAGFEALRAAVPWVAVTHGPEPVRWWGPERSGRVRVPPVAVRDTLGAGDAFHGGFAYGLAHHLSFPGALAFASQVAAVRCAVAGPRAWLAGPELDELAASVVRA